MSDIHELERETSEPSPESETQNITVDSPVPTQDSADGSPGEENGGTEKKKFSLSVLLLEYVELFVTCLGAVLIIFSMLFRVCTVSGDSMMPTLKNGELLLITNLFYEPQQGDIIIFHQTSETHERFNEPIVKRVIATEGQLVYIDFTAGIIEVDGIELQEDYIQLVNSLGYHTGEYTLFAKHNFQMIPFSDGTTHYVFEATVPEGCLFVMGDNRNNSADSRDTVIGFVDERRVLGQVLCRIDKGLSFQPVN